MRRDAVFRAWPLAALLGLLAAGGVAAGVPPSARLYEITTQTAMPHLEESLRYATRTERLCLDRTALAGAFWMLREPALQDCALREASRSEAVTTYVLRCAGDAGTTGRAEWHADGDTLVGTMHVRLGGKNMTFWQRATAKAVGACPSSSSR
ncbi:MAG TPA: hypothetical protein VFZ93_06595 [Albitalea sp.]